MDPAVDKYIAKQDSPQREICEKVRGLLLRTIPDIQEEMKWGVPAYGGGRFYFVALRDHVNIGFSLKGLTPEETALFEGSGKTMRHVKVLSPESMDTERITSLLHLVQDRHHNSVT